MQRVYTRKNSGRRGRVWGFAPHAQASPLSQLRTQARSRDYDSALAVALGRTCVCARATYIENVFVVLGSSPLMIIVSIVHSLSFYKNTEAYY